MVTIVILIILKMILMFTVKTLVILEAKMLMNFYEDNGDDDIDDV